MMASSSAANSNGNGNGSGTKITPGTWVPMGSLMAAIVIIVGGGWAFINDSVDDIKSKQTEQFALMAAKLDTMNETVVKIEKQQYRMEMIAQGNWTALLMSKWATKFRELNKDKGIAVPDPLDFIATGLPPAGNH